jgi:hypothetical protein
MFLSYPLPKYHVPQRRYNATRSDGERRAMSTQEDTRTQEGAVPRTDQRFPDYNHQLYGDRRKPKIFDSTINIPTVMSFIGMIVMVAGFMISIYTSFDKRLSQLENSDKEQEAHFVRLEASNQEFKSDTKGSLNSIQSTVGQIRDWMLQDGRVANRPDAQQWTRK